MSKDLARILRDWDFDPDEISVRIVPGDDGRDKIQMRVELGALQMELDGRPDGERPENCESWLDYYEEQRRIYESTRPEGPPFRLGEPECVRLWREGVQYYHRYLSFWHLDEFERCARDTARNLRLFAFVKAHAEQDRYKLHFDQWRPYVTMMHTRASAMPLLKNSEPDRALAVIEAGIDAIHEFLDEYGQGQRAHECAELTNLERWRDEILRNGQTAAPQGKIHLLRQQLDEAVAAEEFEQAARLRDEIRRLSEQA
jgi:hypothetical protein